MKLTRKQVISTLLEIMDSMPDDACGDWRDSLAYAISIMRKYQKIKEIVKNTDRNAGIVRNALAFGDIAKVVEDEKTD